MYVSNWSIEDICEFAISHIAKDPGNKVIIFGVDFTADVKLIVKKKSQNKDYKEDLGQFRSKVRTAVRERGMDYDE